MPLRAAENPKPRIPVIVELFTSQGCSSCPPADKVLAVFANEQPIEGVEIIPLSEHVDYWNHLGWRDPFSNRQFSERQEEYSEHFRREGVYTPQMVIHGNSEVNGSDWKTAARQIQKASQVLKDPARIRVVPRGVDRRNVATFALTVDRMPQLTPGDTALVWFAVTESGLESAVARGENSGKTLTHTGVVRTMVHAGELKAGQMGMQVEARVPLHKEWKAERLKAVVFVQEKKAKRMLGVLVFPVS